MTFSSDVTFTIGALSKAECHITVFCVVNPGNTGNLTKRYHVTGFRKTKKTVDSENKEGHQAF